MILGLAPGSTTDSLDPTTYSIQVPITIGFQFRNRLVGTDLAGAAVGELAESWEALEGAKRWVFKLRRGVTFSNGKDLTAADVVYSLYRHCGPQSKSGAKGQMDVIEEVKQTAPLEVTISLKSPNADLAHLMSDYHLLIQPEGERPDSGIGTGPFILDVVQPGVRYLARRNSNYWRGDRPHVDSVETLVINDPTARVSALVSGQVHAITRVEPKVVAMLRKTPGIEVMATAGRGYYSFLMHCDTPPFDNADLRLAMKYAVDRKGMLERILSGYGRIGNDSPINGAYPFHPDDIAQRLYDPDRAAFHYKRSGHSGALVLHTSDHVYPGAVDAAVLYRESAARAGIEIEVRREPGDSYATTVWRVVPFCASYSTGRATQDQVMSKSFKTDAVWNDSNWHRPAFDKIINEARAELDPTRRKALYREANLMIVEDGGAIIPVFNDYIDATRRPLRGFVADPAGEACGNHLAEIAWLDS